ncbi:MAG: calcium/sodium antiporter [Cellvibrionales bacterium]|nr:calcium/sodium antiporter [Cellvibrionales bacterium]
MIQAVLFILVGFTLLIISADKFIEGAASIADNTGMSKLMIGLTIVAFGTSAPEMLVSLLAAINGSDNIAVGNAIGSNITNIGLILGITVLLIPLPIQARLFKVDLPLLLMLTLITGGLLFDYHISLLESCLLLGLLIAYLFYLYRDSQKHPTDHQVDDEVDEFTGLSLPKAWAYFVVGLIVLVGSAQLLVSGAVDIARFFGVSELVIGVTIIALGTSLPELAASIGSARQGHYDITFGNIIGSNMFNLLVVLAMPGLVKSSQLDHAVLTRDYTTMLTLTSVLLILCFGLYKAKKRFGRVPGFLLIAIFGVYYAVLFSQILR